MNALTRDLIKLVDMTEEMMKEKEQKEGADYREKLHLMPPVGWLNDPNGLCQLNGIYHAFFQYSPFNAEGGVKMWGHYTSKDMIDWEYQGVKLYPDQPFDCHGVYSGSAFIEDDKMYVYYTGNVKLEDGDFDYINTGRESNTVLVVSEDGKTFGSKKELMRNVDYPSDLTCHVRDPKVWKDGDTYYMIQGARTKEDVGQALIFESKDKINWKFRSRVESEKPFGYMWECPDYFELDGKKFLSVSPQGLKREEFRFQNIYQSGYFPVKEDGSVDERDFREWDMGFDFYAPQTFTDNSGRRLLIGWMGMPDAEEEYTNKTIDEGWQHCLTVPRELRVKDEKIFQYPAKELERLRKEKTILDDEKSIVEVRVEVNEGFDLLIEDIAVTDRSFQISMGGQMLFKYENEIAEIGFSEIAGAGRNKRKAKVSELNNIRILADTSAVELYLNDGEIVFSTRYYPDREDLQLKVKGGKFRGNLWNLRKMIFTK